MSWHFLYWYICTNTHSINIISWYHQHQHSINIASIQLNHSKTSSYHTLSPRMTSSHQLLLSTSPTSTLPTSSCIFLHLPTSSHIFLYLPTFSYLSRLRGLVKTPVFARPPRPEHEADPHPVTHSAAGDVCPTAFSLHKDVHKEKGNVRYVEIVTKNRILRFVYQFGYVPK